MCYFEEQLIMMWFLQICMALKHLHDSHIIHRDVKTANIFLTSKNVVKLGDFGISTVLKDTTAVAHTVCGTPYYFSPEICQNKPYGSKSDVWALGIVLYEMACLRRPFNAKGLKELMRKIVAGSVDPIPSHYDPQLALLIGKLLTVHPTMRPSINRVLESSYVQESLRAFSQELASQTERDKAIYDEKRRRRPRPEAPVQQPAPAPVPAPAPAKPDSKEEQLSFEDLKKLDRGALKKALSAHKETAEKEMAKAESPKAKASQVVDDGDSDGDEDHVLAKQSLRGKINHVIEMKGKLGDNNVMEPANRDESSPAKREYLMRMPNGEMMESRDVRRFLETQVSPELLRRATDYLNAKLTDADEGQGIGDEEIQLELAEILKGKAQYANVVSRLVVFEAASVDSF